MKRLIYAIFFVLSNFSHAGEWHSKGAAPAPPHRPTGRANYSCRMTTYTYSGSFGDPKHKAYMTETERVIRDEEFREPGYGSAGLTVKGEADPGMNGQSMSLSFSSNQKGEEVLNLTIRTEIDGQARSSTRFAAPRSNGEISGSASLSSKKANRQRVTSVQVEVRCLAID